MIDKILTWDRDLFRYLNDLGSDKYDGLWIAISSFYTWIPLYIILILLLFWKNSRQKGFWLFGYFISMLLILTGTMLLTKVGVARIRPNNELALSRLIMAMDNPVNYSFFSGHAASAFGIATLSVLFLRKKTKMVYLVYLWALLVSFSRIYLGVHYPSDVLVGAFVGIFFGWLFYRLFQKFKEPYLT